MTIPSLTPPTDRDLLTYALLKARDTGVAFELIEPALARVDAGELPTDDTTRAAAAAAAAALQRVADDLPGVIARLQNLAQRPDKELPL
jgi:hypothetical protein